MRRPRPGWILALLLVLTGCVAVPNAERLAVRADRGPPRIDGPRGPIPPRLSKSEIERLARSAGGDEALLREVALQGATAGTPLVAGNRVTLLQNGRPTYDAMMQAILSARTNISLESYIFEGDSIGRAIADLLAERSRAGVKVQIIYDSEGSVDTPNAQWDMLRAAGVQILEYNPLNPIKARGGYDPNDRDHRKLLVIDGRLAIMGGINISEIYLYGGVEPGSTDRWWVPWRDTDIAVEGPVVSEYQQFFVNVWTEQHGDPLPATVRLDKPPALGDSFVRALPGSPQDGDPEIYVALLSAIRRARHNVWLTTAFFDPTEEARAVLADAARRGVDVELSVPGESDSQATLAAGRSRYQELLDAGVKIWERRDVFLHGKTATIDGVWSTVGSANLNSRSVLWNNELCTIVLGRDFARQMEDAFRRDRAHGTPILPAAWARRPLGERLIEWSARALEALL